MAKLSNILGNSTINGSYEKSVSQFIRASIKLEGGWKLSRVSFLVLAGAIAFVVNPALAQIQIIPDHTLGAGSSTVTPDVINGIPSDRIDGGAIRGVNLFHSFQEFNVDNERGAYFTNPSGIENILSRVTGSNSSNIQGTLGVTGGNANLFLINPNGIIFGSNARLDVGGSFLASTANSFTFPDGTHFSATNPETPPLLTINVPIGLQYGANPGSIQVQGAILEVPSGETLALVGGNVSLTGGRLLAQGGELASSNPLTPGGRVELGGLAGAGTVLMNANGTLTFPDGVARADVSLTNGAQVNVRAGDGGSIAVNTHNLNISGGSSLIAGIRSQMGGGDAQAGDIEINATGAVTLAGQDSRIRNSVNVKSIGQAGEIRINAESLTLTGGAQLDTSIYRDGQGKAGNITVNVDDTVTLDGVGENGQSSRIHSEVMQRAEGNGGDILIEAKSVFLTNGGQLNAQTNGMGNAGNINLTVSDTLSLDGVGTNGSPSSIRNPVQQNAVGNAGDIIIEAGSFIVTDGGELRTETEGQGNAGNIRITASDTVSFDGVNSGSKRSTVAFTRVEETGVGNAGNIDIKARSVSITNGAELLSDTYNKGNAGDITIVAQDLVLVDGVSPVDPSNPESPSSGIISSVQKDAIGNGGNINIMVAAGSLFVTNGAYMSASTAGSGNTGHIFITVEGTVELVGTSAPFSSTGIFTQVEPDATGNGGSLKLITNGQLNIRDEAQVSVINQGLGYAGNLSVIARFILLDNQAKLIAISTSGLGGSINVAVADLLLLRRNSLILAINGSADTSGLDGNISIDTGSLVVVPIENSDIEAYGFGRHPGSNIQIIAPGLFGIEYREQLTPKSDIVSSGSVVLMTSGIDPSQGLTEIPTGFVEAPKPIGPNCTSGNVSAFKNRFTVTGRGGLPPNPYEPFSSSNIWEDTPLPIDRIEQPAHTASISPVPSPTPIVEAQAWLVNDKGEVVLVDKMPTLPRGCHYSF